MSHFIHIAFCFSITIFLYTQGQIYISEYTELLLFSETFTIPKEISEAAEVLLNNLMSIEAIKRSPMKRRLSFKGKVMKVSKN